MGLFSVGEAGIAALSGMPVCRSRARSGAPHPTGAPVLRGSREAGTFEETFFAVPAKGETDRLLSAARRALDEGRRLKSEARAGKRSLSAAERLLTLLTGAAIRVYEELMTIARLCRGQIYPSYAGLAERTGLGEATIGRVLNILEKVGLLARQRRFKRVPGSGPGPRYAQTSNVYRALLPDCVKRVLPRRLRPAPLPDDDIQRRADVAQATRGMLERLGLGERARVEIGGELGELLARMGATIEHRERDTHYDEQPLKDSI
ncbi:helix-turn-helix domain-containing protein (plasmid) [Sphingomonas panni]|jgi:predicted transcriptional regulator